ncbi:hypothetical protein K438DRAFT_2009973 [Mycena galopus ATCC 62051]|nr:hypothetical protein K438DRAFT_2009973 [Mycena galopus ATCC 62051]
MAPRFALIRLVVLSTVVVFSLVALGMAAAFTSSWNNFISAIGLDEDISIPFASLGIASAVLTIVTVPAMIALEILRPGGPTSMIVVEIAWLAFLSILWLSTGAETAESNPVGSFGFSCGDSKAERQIALGGDDVDNDFNNLVNSICTELPALEAFAFVTWIILMGYVGMLLVMSIMAANRKHTNVWTSSVAQAPFSEPAPSSYGSYSHNASAGQAAPYSTSGSVQAGTVHV